MASAESLRLHTRRATYLVALQRLRLVPQPNANWPQCRPPTYISLGPAHFYRAESRRGAKSRREGADGLRRARLQSRRGLHWRAPGRRGHRLKVREFLQRQAGETFRGRLRVRKFLRVLRGVRGKSPWRLATPRRVPAHTIL